MSVPALMSGRRSRSRECYTPGFPEVRPVGGTISGPGGSVRLVVATGGKFLFKKYLTTFPQSHVVGATAHSASNRRVNFRVRFRLPVVRDPPLCIGRTACHCGHCRREGRTSTGGPSRKVKKVISVNELHQLREKFNKNVDLEHERREFRAKIGWATPLQMQNAGLRSDSDGHGCWVATTKSPLGP